MTPPHGESVPELREEMESRPGLVRELRATRVLTRHAGAQPYCARSNVGQATHCHHVDFYVTICSHGSVRGRENTSLCSEPSLDRGFKFSGGDGGFMYKMEKSSPLNQCNGICRWSSIFYSTTSVQHSNILQH